MTELSLTTQGKPTACFGQPKTSATTIFNNFTAHKDIQTNKVVATKPQQLLCPSDIAETTAEHTGVISIEESENEGEQLDQSYFTEGSFS